jgi:two-component system, OmpR family, KDP operon response regulator KdpE
MAIKSLYDDPALVITKVLVIDVQAQVRRFLRTGFGLQGDFQVIEAESGTAGLRATIFDKPDLIILDPHLPDIDGLELLESIRSLSNVSIIVVSTEGAEQQKVRLLRHGADDYVVKPFGMLELLARAEAVLRRTSISENRDAVVKAGPLSIDLVARVVSLTGRRVKLTRKEYTLLRLLATHAGRVVTHQQLMKGIWGASGANTQYLRILVRKLRKRIEADPTYPSLVVSESGVGYRLASSSTGSALESTGYESAGALNQAIHSSCDVGQLHTAKEPGILTQRRHQA